LNKRQRWIKRGAGTLLLDKNGEETRLLMLNETTDVRVMLNLRLFFGMKAFIMEERSICFNLFDTMKDIYGKAEVKLVNYAIKVDDAKTAQQICKHINTSIPSFPCCVPKRTIDEFISKDITAIIDQLMPKKQWEF
jgi:hypothetical protein